MLRNYHRNYPVLGAALGPLRCRLGGRGILDEVPWLGYVGASGQIINSAINS